MSLEEEGLADYVIKCLNIPAKELDLTEWEESCKQSKINAIKK